MSSLLDISMVHLVLHTRICYN